MSIDSTDVKLLAVIVIVTIIVGLILGNYLYQINHSLGTVSIVVVFCVAVAFALAVIFRKR